LKKRPAQEEICINYYDPMQKCKGKGILQPEGGQDDGQGTYKCKKCRAWYTTEDLEAARKKHLGK
jgi:hypothetical protein